MSELPIPIEAETRTGARPLSVATRTHVLIVDDHAGARALYAAFCDLFDHTTQTARSVVEAVEAVKRARFDVVVMNVGMKGVSGFDAIRAIRELPGPAAVTPIIGVTPLGRGDDAQRWLALGVSGVVNKPVTASRLFAAIRSALEPSPGGPRSWAPSGA
ncbi:MAG: response regulator [Caulobacterales bacterium]